MSAPQNGEFMLPYSVPVDDRHVHKYQLDMGRFTNNPITDPRYNEVRSALTPVSVPGNDLMQAWKDQVYMSAPQPPPPEPVEPLPPEPDHQDYMSWEFNWDQMQQVVNDVPQSLWVLFALLVFMLMVFSIRTSKPATAAAPPGGFDTLIIPDTN